MGGCGIYSIIHPAENSADDITGKSLKSRRENEK
jgi:hypothetical protein